MTKTIDNSEDIIDSRDVIARIEELEGELADLVGDVPMSDSTAEQAEAIEALGRWKDDYGDELDQLKALAEQGEGYGDWEYGETLIRESYFEDYAQDLAYDLGAVKKDSQWPNNHIDWAAAANELKIDYTELDFGGVSYLMRA